MRARRTNLAFGALLAISGLLAPAAAQDKPVDLKLSHWVPPTHPLQKAMEAWGNSVKVASGGSISETGSPTKLKSEKAMKPTTSITMMPCMSRRRMKAII